MSWEDFIIVGLTRCLLLIHAVTLVFVQERPCMKKEDQRIDRSLQMFKPFFVFKLSSSGKNLENPKSWMPVSHRGIYTKLSMNNVHVF